MRAVWKGAFFMIELIKKEIHMNRQRGTAVSQLTLDDDFIVPDALDDAVQILLSDGEVQIENSRIQGEKVLIRGKLVFRVLYRRESGGLQAMGGEIPFEETVNVPELSERDYTQIVWNIEDLNITMIHSRKLSAKAVLTLTVRAESRVDAQAAADVETDDAGLQVLKRSVPAATLAVRRKDIYRVREEADRKISRRLRRFSGRRCVFEMFRCARWMENCIWTVNCRCS